MATDIIMPNLGFDVQEGRLVEWLKQPGDTVQRGEVIAIVESDKANVELESIAGGVLLDQQVAEGQLVKVGDVLAHVGEAGEKVAATDQASASPERSSQAPEVSAVARRMAAEHDIDLNQVTGTGPKGRITKSDVEAVVQGRTASRTSGNGRSGILALPKVRKAAREAGIELADVPATGSKGQITMADLESYQRNRKTAPVAEPATAPIEGKREVTISPLRRRIGERMGKSTREAPHFYVAGEFDLEAALTKLSELPEPQPRINDLLQYLTVRTLLRVPELNATYENGRLYHYQPVNLAVAVAREDGLISPVIAGAERYSLQGIAAESRALIQRVHENRLQPADLQEGTFTISNLGVIPQVDQFTAVINPPQVAILAVGTVKPRPVVVGGGLHIRHTVHLMLSGDHRAVDGIHLGRFMSAFQDELDTFSD